MGSRLGLDAVTYRNTGTHGAPAWNEVGNIRDLTLNLEAGEADVTTRNNNGWRATMAALLDGSCDFQMVWNTGDADFQAIKTAFFAKGSIEFCIMSGPINDPESEGLRATFQVTKFTKGEPLEEAQTVDVTIKPTYSDNAPEWIGGDASSSGV